MTTTRTIDGHVFHQDGDFQGWTCRDLPSDLTIFRDNLAGRKKWWVLRVGKSDIWAPDFTSFSNVARYALNIYYPTLFSGDS